MKNIVWHPSQVPPDKREQLLGQQGCVLWFTGLSGSGKSTLALKLEERLVSTGRLAYVLDGDNVRHGLNADLGFSPQDREENIRRVSEVAALFADAGLIVLASFISPYHHHRTKARECATSHLGPNRFLEIFVDTPLSICEARDPKNLYRKARAGEIPEFTGVSAPYEIPKQPDIHLKTANVDPDSNVAHLIDQLDQRNLIVVDK